MVTWSFLLYLLVAPSYSVGCLVKTERAVQAWFFALIMGLPYGIRHIIFSGHRARKVSVI
ncbi:hypothetical protein BJX68DRAFT_234573, partial [Aspergillus pseudodeflectus]